MLDNPLSKVWSLVFQDNLKLSEGDLVEGTITSNVLFFQPSLPIPAGKYVFIARPVFPLVTAPDFQMDGTGKTKITGFGDVQLFVMAGPSKINGAVWGIGATFKFPTASDPQLGAGKWQAGPAAMLFHFSQKWSKGILLQHWWSIGGQANREDVITTEIQYVIRRNLRNAWSIGMGPNIVINWTAEQGNRLTFPIGLGITKTVKIGKTPLKMRIEPQYSLVYPKNYGTVWNIRFQFAPILKNPLLKKELY